LNAATTLFAALGAMARVYGYGPPPGIVLPELEGGSEQLRVHPGDADETLV